MAHAAEHKPSTPYLFYTFPNSTSADATGWTDPFTPRKARMVVTATIDGTKYYYPVTVSNPERNKAYTVELTITGLGSTDPDTPIEKGAVEASIVVQEWVAGTTYEEVL